MKQIKLLVLAFTILLGATFTSCLDSDDSPMTYYAFATVRDTGLNYITFITDDGLTLTPTNPTGAQYQDGTYPKRAYFAYNLADGKERQQGVTKYEINFLQHLATVSTPHYSQVKVESKTDIAFLYQDGWAWAANDYLNVRVGVQYGQDTDLDEDFTLYPEEVDSNNVLYFRLVHTKEVAKKEGNFELFMSFDLPSRYDLQSKFEELQFSGDNNDEIQVVITANEGDELIKTDQFKISIPY